MDAVAQEKVTSLVYGWRLERSDGADLIIALQPVAEPATGGEGQ